MQAEKNVNLKFLNGQFHAEVSLSASICATSAKCHTQTRQVCPNAAETAAAVPPGLIAVMRPRKQCTYKLYFLPFVFAKYCYARIIILLRLITTWTNKQRSNNSPSSVETTRLH